jgi:hypothetical protein
MYQSGPEWTLIQSLLALSHLAQARPGEQDFYHLKKQVN